METVFGPTAGYESTRRMTAPAKATAKASSKRIKIPRRQTLDRGNLELLGRRLFRLTPSATWKDDLESLIIAGKVAYKDKQAAELDKKAVFPPGGKRATLMRHCRGCGSERWFPPQYLAAGLCAECIENGRAPHDRSADGTAQRSRPGMPTDDLEMRRRVYMDVEGAVWGQTWDPLPEEEVLPEPPNPHVEILEALEDRGVILAECPLPSENVAVLARMIQQHKQGEGEKASS